MALGIPILAESPFSAVQLLWINLIMDTFAAFALATEEPLDSVLCGPPFKEDSNVLTPVIWRSILGISFWNVMVMLFMMIFGPLIADLPYDYTTTANDTDPAPTPEEPNPIPKGNNKLRHLTLLFNTFIFL
jgi:Ca2+ transporting ATPase